MKRQSKPVSNIITFPTKYIPQQGLRELPREEFVDFNKLLLTGLARPECAVYDGGYAIVDYDANEEQVHIWQISRVN